MRCRRQAGSGKPCGRVSHRASNHEWTGKTHWSRFPQRGVTKSGTSLYFPPRQYDRGLVRDSTLNAEEVAAGNNRLSGTARVMRFLYTLWRRHHKPTFGQVQHLAQYCDFRFKGTAGTGDGRADSAGAILPAGLRADLYRNPMKCPARSNFGAVIPVTLSCEIRIPILDTGQRAHNNRKAVRAGKTAKVRICTPTSRRCRSRSYHMEDQGEGSLCASR